MQYGTFLYEDQHRKEMKEERVKVKNYPIVSWEEVIQLNFNRVSNTDATGTSFEGEIESILKVGNQIILKCKWINAFAPVFDEDGDIDRDRMCWKPWNVKEACFSVQSEPRQVPGTSSVIITLPNSNFATTTTLSKVDRFNSLR